MMRSEHLKNILLDVRQYGDIRSTSDIEVSPEFARWLSLHGDLGWQRITDMVGVFVDWVGEVMAAHPDEGVSAFPAHTLDERLIEMHLAELRQLSAECPGPLWLERWISTAETLARWIRHVKEKLHIERALS